MDSIEDGDGIAAPSQSDVPEDENSRLDDSRDSELSKPNSSGGQINPSTDKRYTDSNTFRNFGGFSIVNGDSVDKNVDVSEHVLRSSSTNSLSSMYSETTRDSIHDDSSAPKEIDSGSENDSKSSYSEASVREGLPKFAFNLSKSEDSRHMSSDLSDSSSDSESSESDDSRIERDEKDFSENKVDDNTRSNTSPDRSNISGDSEKEHSSEVDNLKEKKDLKSNNETKNSDDLNKEHAVTKDSSDLLSVASKSENISIDQDQQERKAERIDQETSDKIFAVENLNSSPTNKNLKSQESAEKSEPCMDSSSKALSDLTMDVKNNTVNSALELTPHNLHDVDVKTNEPSDLNLKVDTERDFELNEAVDEKVDEQNKRVDDINNKIGEKSNEPINKDNDTTDKQKDIINENVNEHSNEYANTSNSVNIKVDKQNDQVDKKVDEPDGVVDDKVEEPISILDKKVDKQNNKVDDKNETVNEQSDKDPLVSKEKKEDRVNIKDLGEQFSINYTGFKMSRNISGVSSDNKYVLKSNPFNPAWNRKCKNRFGLSRNCRDEIDCSTLQPEYAQYLGLQPIVKFKCSNCGMSTFQTMNALNTHQVECKKNGKLISHTSEISQASNFNSANIKLTRKVFLCSHCGTYYENCDLFLHMREFHRRYICLFCLFMAQSPDVLQEHLRDKHNIASLPYPSVEELQKNSPQTFFLLCLRCDRVFTEMDDSANHKCTNKNSLDIEQSSFKRPRTDNIHLQDSLNDSSLAAYDSSKSKTSPKVIKEGNVNKFNALPRVGNEKYTEDQSKETINANFCEHPMDVDSKTINNKTERHDAVLEAENLQLKVPSGIEIKPLLPGEHISPDRNDSNRSAIEIFPISTEPKKKVKLVKKTKKVIKKTVKRKPINVIKIKKIAENMLQTVNEVPTQTNYSEAEPQLTPAPEAMQEDPAESHDSKENEQACPPPVTSVCNDIPEMKRSHSQEVFKIKLQPEYYSDEESDDSQKLSMVVDENTNNSDTELRRAEEPPDNSSKEENSQSDSNYKLESNEIALAREDVAAMALTLDDKIENVPIQAVVKECVRTSCLSCNYCRHACKIAVNGKQLALHLLSEHRYTPVKNETHDDVVRKLSSSMDILQNMHFNTETYDSSDPSIHIPYDQEKNFDCFQCSYVSSSHKDLYAHKKKSHTKSLLLCIMCKSNFYSYSELICHICPGSYNAKVQFHNVDLIFRCCFCRLDTIPSAFRLMVHLRKSHHTCDICLEMCTDQQKLSTHMWKHKLNHLCYRCGIAYASKPDITKHLFWKHGTESVLCKKCLQKKWPHVYHFCIPPTSFICEECNISFSKAVALKVHKRIHGDDYPYSCEQCEKKFVSKKLLSRHIERHVAIAQRKEKLLNTPNEEKEEIINVTDINDGKECLLNENSDVNKESDGKDKGHKKHKKEKEKKEKKVVDVYDLPPLNLSSESDSSDEEESSKVSPSKEGNMSEAVSSDVKLRPLFDEQNVNEPGMSKLDASAGDNFHNSLPTTNEDLSSTIADCTQKQESKTLSNIGVDEALMVPSASDPISSFDKTADVNNLLPLTKDQVKIDEIESTQNDQVEGIWENFYKTNPQNSNLPFPLCAMKSEIAYSIIMGDHDYCIRPKSANPDIKEDHPTVSNLVASLSDDKLEEITPIIPEKPPQTPPQKEQEASSTPTSISKKKLKSPRKKMLKTPDDNNSSSSSDSSSDSDTSSCSCGTNCSCSSSSSNSSSSSSSDSDSSINDDKIKQDKRKRRKDKRIKAKSESEVDPVKETVNKEPEVVLPVMPEDPPIRESELETDELTSDEEFYDRQPQIIANQMLAEKRQLVLLATGTPAVNNGNASPTVAPPPQETVIVPPPPEPIETPKQRVKPKRKRKVGLTPKLPKTEKTAVTDSYSKFLNEPKPYSPFQHGISTPKQKPQIPIPQSPSLPEAGGSGPESDNTRLSKRRRVPNKFYGYSSGEEEEGGLGGVKQTPKWRKLESQMTPVHTPKIQPTVPPPTPRIQLTVPKQVIRKPTYHKASMKAKQQQWSESSDSGTSDVEDRIPRPAPQEPIKAEKDLYCYCRCPYDEVSEMIACDDANCKIEWFHFECVGILVPPRGQWFCPGCRKARGLPT